MIYLDNAATSYPKPETVYKEVERCMRDYCANPGRGGHKMSIISGRAVMSAREVVSSFFNIKNPLQLCFMKNATEALNTAIKGYVSEKMHVVTTSMEHNAVARPLNVLKRDGVIELTIVEANPYGEIDPEIIRKSIRKNTGLIVCTFSSNVNGTILPVKEIGRIASEHGIAFLVDAAQGAGDAEIDVEKMHIDMMAFPGHKGLLGPQGTGGLYVSERIKLRPLMEGGTGSNSEYIYQPEFMPDKLESGTLNTPGIIGLKNGVEFINNAGKTNLRLYKEYLYKRLYDGTRGIRGIKIYSLGDEKKNSGILALNIEGLDSTQVSEILDKDYDIATRAGLHCAPLAHRTLGTLKTGVVRLSPGPFNTAFQIDRTIEALERIAWMHGT